uniref:Uncharacterized protein n=1 Tax=Glossina brevipalpis TaxID=37001 RepID=A0A1A9X265_9MUSC
MLTLFLRCPKIRPQDAYADLIHNTRISKNSSYSGYRTSKCDIFVPSTRAITTTTQIKSELKNALSKASCLHEKAMTMSSRFSMKKVCVFYNNNNNNNNNNNSNNIHNNKELNKT